MSQRLHKELVDRILVNKYIDFPETSPAKENMQLLHRKSLKDKVQAENLD